MAYRMYHCGRAKVVYVSVVRIGRRDADTPTIGSMEILGGLQGGQTRAMRT